MTAIHKTDRMLAYIVARCEANLVDAMLRTAPVTSGLRSLELGR